MDHEEQLVLALVFPLVLQFLSQVRPVRYVGLQMRSLRQGMDELRTMTNFFEQVADSQTVSPVKAKMAAAERRQAKKEERANGVLAKPTWQELKREEDAVLAKLYRRWRAGVKAEVVAANVPGFANLLRLIRKLDWANAPRVVDFVESAEWLHHADENTRLETLRFIEDSFCRSRVRHGLPTFDDALPGEPLTPFLAIRKRLFGV